MRQPQTAPRFPTARRTRCALRGGVILGATALALTACGSGFDDGPAAGDDAGDFTSGADPLTVLIGSSGDSETAAVEDAVAAWSEESGLEASVQIANDLTQQLSQGFASGDPADLFYLSTDAIAGYAANGSLQPYGDHLENRDDFYPSLVENFTVEDQFHCAPKDFSTLALIINDTLWSDAGLTDDDVPATWEELAGVAEQLTTEDQVGLTFSPEYQRLGVFMAQAGGALVEDGAAVADSAENVEALEYVQEQLDAGSFAFSSDIGAGWGGEAFGTEDAAMVIEGNWITGALANDFPDLDYTVAELPGGPAGPGTLQFTNCWGMAADSLNQEAALDLVEHLTSTEQQLEFSERFGPMPSVESAAAQWSEENPELTAFLDGAEYAQFPPHQAGAADVIADLNSQLEDLDSADAESLLDSVQANLEPITE
ncbi:extracellular solute-binding protein [Nesterenkonia sp. CL21]|uniref:sugar ABC transporter substrate-binding protein n=1 Tax=Nesterenkonia sp. CL21 TaxID=3064894 RepID=UPI002879C083|nr:extracellular solute-binding protein [Nesterenkonia sp. CL21]MDS2172967.1 extracellular solute-binding protein [Nesterenkonia sp. CL21]